MDDKKKTGFAAHPENINRKGRPPKGSTITDRIMMKLEDTISMVKRTKDGKRRRVTLTYVDALVDTLFRLAFNGDRKAIRDIVERVEGKPLQQVIADMKHTIVVDSEDEHEEE